MEAAEGASPPTLFPFLSTVRPRMERKWSTVQTLNGVEGLHCSLQSTVRTPSGEQGASAPTLFSSVICTDTQWSGEGLCSLNFSPPFLL